MIKILLLLLFCCSAFGQGEYIDTNSVWSPVYQQIRDRAVAGVPPFDSGVTVTNGYGNGLLWQGASYYLSSDDEDSYVPDFSPNYRPSFGYTTNGVTNGWVRWGVEYNEAGNESSLQDNTVDYMDGDGQFPYLSFLTKEAQTAWYKEWFDAARWVTIGTETNWSGTTAGETLTLTNALALASLSNGFRRAVTNYPVKPYTSAQFTNGWIASGDYIGDWIAEDLTNALAKLKSARYSLYPASRSAQAPTFCTPCGWTSNGVWNLSNLAGQTISNKTIGANGVILIFGTEKEDLVVTLSGSPNCDGSYLSGYLSDYGRYYPTNLAESTINNVDLSGSNTWAMWENDIHTWGVFPGFVTPTNVFVGVSNNVFEHPFEGVGNPYRIDIIDTNTTTWGLYIQGGYPLYEFSVETNSAVVPNPDCTGNYDTNTRYRDDSAYRIIDSTTDTNYCLGTYAYAYHIIGDPSVVEIHLGTNAIPAGVAGTYTQSASNRMDGTNGYDLYRHSFLWSIVDTGEVDNDSFTNSYFFFGFRGSSGSATPTTNRISTGTVYAAAQTWWNDTLRGEYTNRVYYDSQNDTNYSAASGTAYVHLGTNAYLKVGGATVEGTYEPHGRFYTGPLTPDYEMYQQYYLREESNSAVLGFYDPYGAASGNPLVENGRGWVGEDLGDAVTLFDVWIDFDAWIDIAMTNVEPQISLTESAAFVEVPSRYGDHKSLSFLPITEYYIGVPINPTNLWFTISMEVTESREVIVPTPYVNQRFGDSSYISSDNDLPSIINYYLYSECGYFRNNGALNIENLNRYPSYDGKMLDDTYLFPLNSNYTANVVTAGTNFTQYIIEWDM